MQSPTNRPSAIQETSESMMRFMLFSAAVHIVWWVHKYGRLRQGRTSNRWTHYPIVMLAHALYMAYGVIYFDRGLINTIRWYAWVIAGYFLTQILHQRGRKPNLRHREHSEELAYVCVQGVAIQPVAVTDPSSRVMTTVSPEAIARDDYQGDSVAANNQALSLDDQRTHPEFPHDHLPISTADAAYTTYRYLNLDDDIRLCDDTSTQAPMVRATAVKK